MEVQLTSFVKVFLGDEKLCTYYSKYKSNFYSSFSWENLQSIGSRFYSLRKNFQKCSTTFATLIITSYLWTTFNLI